MVIYYGVLFYILILGFFFFRRTDDHAKKQFLLLVFMGLFLLMALRAETVGTDNSIYMNKFYLVSKADTWEKIMLSVSNAPVYNLLSKAVSLVGDYRLMMIVVAAIIMSAAAIYIYHYSDNVFLSTYCFVALYFYLHAYNISRQFLSLALVLLALCCRKKKKNILCVISFLLAVGIHSLSAVALPQLILNQERITKKRFGIYLTVATVGGLLLPVIFDRAISIFSTLFPRYHAYLHADKYSVFTESGGGARFLALFYLLFSVFAVVIQSNRFKEISLDFSEQSRLRYLIILVAVGAVVGILLGANMAMTRVLYFYQIHAICLIPNTFCKIERQQYYYLYYALLLLILLVPFAICLSRNFGDVVPFVPMWQ